VLVQVTKEGWRKKPRAEYNLKSWRRICL